jgi:hypothetical protein
MILKLSVAGLKFQVRYLAHITHEGDEVAQMVEALYFDSLSYKWDFSLT